MGRCCDGKIVKAVTIKSLDQGTGATIWEYGPGSLWRQQHEGTRITGIQWSTASVLDSFVLICDVPDLWLNVPTIRQSGAFEPNAMFPLELVTLDANDGTVLNVVDLDLICYAVSDSQANLGTLYTQGGYFIRGVLTLSGGDYLIAGLRPPALEWVDYTTDTANKEYVLHAHILQAGYVYLKTKTSGETITLPYNATASEVETAFEATADCVSCTATGGPWPHRRIEIDVTWSTATGDISQMKRDATYTSTGSTGTCTWDWQLTPPFGGSWILNTDLCTGGSTATPPAGSGSPGDLGVPGTCTGGTGGTVTTRKCDGCAATYNTTTGLIETSVGYIFGRDTVTPPKLVTETGTVPGYTLGASQPIAWGNTFGYLLENTLAAGRDNCIGVQYRNGATIECWTPGTPWVRNWQKYNNAALEVGIRSSGGYFSIPIPRKTFTGGGTVAAVRIDQATGAVTEYDIPVISTSNVRSENWHGAFLFTDNQSQWVSHQYERWADPAQFGQYGQVFPLDFQGSEFYINGVELKVGHSYLPAIGAANGRLFGNLSGGGYSVVNILKYINTTTAAGGLAWNHNWLFYAPASGTNGPPSQWRMRLRNGNTAWLDWDATDAEIKAAFLAVYPENTSGTSNIEVNPFGAFSSVVNSIGVFEKGLQILFRVARNAAGLSAGFPPGSHFDRLGDVIIEFLNPTGTNDPGISAIDVADGTQYWARSFGTALGSSNVVAYPRAAWLNGTTSVIAYGDQVENDLP